MLDTTNPGNTSSLENAAAGRGNTDAEAFGPAKRRMARWNRLAALGREDAGLTVRVFGGPLDATL